MLCAEKGIAVHWLTGGGNYIGSVTKAAGGVQRRLRQYKALTDDAVKLALAKKLVLAKMESQLRYVLRCTRGKPRSNTVVTAVEAIRHAVSHSQKVKTTEELLGWEGSAAKAYFACFAEFTADELEAGMAFPIAIAALRKTRRMPSSLLLWHAVQGLCGGHHRSGA